MIRLLLDVAFGTRASRKDEKVKRLAAEAAREHAEMTYHSAMAGFYRERADNTDHTQDWWGYANAMQSWYDHEQDYDRYRKRRDTVRAKLEARQNSS